MKKRLVFVDGLLWLVTLDVDHWEELNWTRVQIHEVIEALKNYWWDFMKAIWQAFVHSDMENTDKLVKAFERQIINLLSLNWIK